MGGFLFVTAALAYNLLVPRAGIEPARLAAADFESAASTNSTTEAGVHAMRAVLSLICTPAASLVPGNLQFMPALPAPVAGAAVVAALPAGRRWRPWTAPSRSPSGYRSGCPPRCRARHRTRHVVRRRQHVAERAQLGDRLGADLEERRALLHLVERHAFAQPRVDLHEEVTELVQRHAFALAGFFGRGGAVGQADRGALEGAEHQVGVDDLVFLDRDHAGAFYHRLQQRGAEVGGDLGHMVELEIVPVDTAVGLARQERAQQFAAFVLVRQAEIDFHGEAAQHRFVHLGRGVVEVGGDHPDDAGALVAAHAVQQAQQGVGGVVFPFLFAAATGHEQALRFVEEDDAVAACASLAVQRMQRLGAAADVARFQRRTGRLDQRNVEPLGQVAGQLGFAGTGGAGEHHIKWLVDVVFAVDGAVADHVFQVQHFLLDVFHADQVVHAAGQLIRVEHGGIHARAGQTVAQQEQHQAHQQDVDRVALDEAAGARQGAVVLVHQHGLVRGQVVFAGDGVGNVIAQQDFAFQAQVRGAGHFHHAQQRVALELDDVARRFRQRRGNHQVFQLVALGGQRGDQRNVLGAQQGAGVLRHFLAPADDDGNADGNQDQGRADLVSGWAREWGASAEAAKSRRAVWRPGDISGQILQNIHAIFGRLWPGWQAYRRDRMSFAQAMGRAAIRRAILQLMPADWPLVANAGFHAPVLLRCLHQPLENRTAAVIPELFYRPPTDGAHHENHPDRTCRRPRIVRPSCRPCTRRDAANQESRVQPVRQPILRASGPRQAGAHPGLVRKRVRAAWQHLGGRAPLMQGVGAGLIRPDRRPHPSSVSAPIQAEALVTIGRTPAFPQQHPLLAPVVRRDLAVVAGLLAVLQQEQAAAAALDARERQLRVKRERCALGRAHVGFDAIGVRRQFLRDLARHAGVALAVVEVGQEQRHQQDPDQDQAAGRQHHGAPQHGRTARHAPVHQRKPAGRGQRGNREGNRAHVRRKARHQLQGVLGGLRRPAGQLGKPEDPDHGRAQRERHHREPVDGVDGAALHGQQAERGHHGQRRQQDQQLALFRARRTQGQDGADGDKRQRHHDVQRQVLATPGPDRPAGKRPGRPEEPDPHAEEEFQRHDRRQGELRQVQRTPLLQRLLMVRLQQLRRQQPDAGDGSGHDQGQAQVAQGAAHRLLEQAGAGKHGQHQRYRRDPAVGQRQQADGQAAQGGIAQRRRFHVAHRAVEHEGGQRHAQRIRRGFVAVHQQAQAAEIDQDGGIGQGAAEIVGLGLAAKGQAQRLRILAPAQVEGGVPQRQHAEQEDGHRAHAGGQHVTEQPTEQLDAERADPERQRAFVGNGQAGNIGQQPVLPAAMRHGPHDAEAGGVVVLPRFAADQAGQDVEQAQGKQGQACGVDDFVLAGVERVRFSRHLDFHQWVVFTVVVDGFAGGDGRTGHEFEIARQVVENNFAVIWMGICFHLKPRATVDYTQVAGWCQLLAADARWDPRLRGDDGLEPGWRFLAAAAHHVEELGVVLRGAHFVEDELHRFDLVHRVQQLAQDPDLLQLVRLDQEFFAAGARFVQVDCRVHAFLGQAALQVHLHVAGTLEFFVDHVVHARAGFDQRGGDDGQRTAFFDVTGSAEETFRALQRVGVHTTGQHLARGRDHGVVGAGQAGDRVQQDHHVFFHFDQALGFFQHHLGYLHVARGRFVEGGGDHFAAHRALHLGHFFRALVDQQHDQRHIRVVRGDRVGDVLQHHGFTGLGRRHQQAALALADRRNQVDDTAGDVFGAVDVAFEAQRLVRVQRRQVLEQYAVFRGFRRFAVDLVYLDQRKITLAVFRGAHFALDRVARVQIETADLRRGDIDIVGGRHVAGVGRAQEAEAVRQHFEGAVAENLLAGFGALFQDREHQFLLAQAGRVVDIKTDGHLQQRRDVIDRLSAILSYLDIAVDETGQLTLGHRANFLRRRYTVLEQDQGRDAADAELGRHCLVGIDVHLGDGDLAAVFLGHFFQDGGDALARTAPFGPEIDQYRTSRCGINNAWPALPV
uniref:Uncharacterized protein n=1 Tax=Tanacetum cinerariifolium TaxID=118510 RepID=A0A699GDR4_TANCI|nr:hypothetical protein [Tanacetum cinerariifolium]